MRVLKPIKIGNIYEMPCFHYGPRTDIQDIYNGLKRLERKGGRMVIATHWYHLASNQILRNNYWILIDRIILLEKQDKVKIVRSSELF